MESSILTQLPVSMEFYFIFTQPFDLFLLNEIISTSHNYLKIEWIC